MKKHEGKMVGVLGTVILHLIAAIIFMSFQLRTLQKENGEEFAIEFETVDEAMIEEEIIELPATSIENILSDDQEMLNIARNLANRPVENIDPQEYIDRVKEELIKSGKLGEENYIDEWRQRSESSADEVLSMKEREEDSEQDDQADELQKMEANYQGPTRIFYELYGRNHTYLPIPIYKCQGAGKVVLLIEVNQKGTVEKAGVYSAETTTRDECLYETAVKTALISRFNADVNAPRIQKGTLTYIFVAQ